jgi:hypothetical protein
MFSENNTMNMLMDRNTEYDETSNKGDNKVCELTDSIEACSDGVEKGIFRSRPFVHP